MTPSLRLWPEVQKDISKTHPLRFPGVGSVPKVHKHLTWSKFKPILSHGKSSPPSYNSAKQSRSVFAVCFCKSDWSLLPIFKCFWVPCALGKWAKKAVLESSPSNTVVSSHRVLQRSALDGKRAGLSGGCEVRPWPCRDGRALRSALPGACLAALLAVEFVVADAMLRNKMTPAEEVYTGWILYGEKKSIQRIRTGS